ncbi:vacuolar iron transporter homolog 4-like [Fagus crenata]
MLMGVGMLANGIKAMLLTSFIGLVAGTLNLAIAQYVSVYTQYDIMTFQAKKNMRMGRGGNMGTVPSPTLVAVASSSSWIYRVSEMQVFCCDYSGLYFHVCGGSNWSYIGKGTSGKVLS